MNPDIGMKRYLRQEKGWLFEDFGEEILLFSLEDYRPRLLLGAAAEIFRLTDGRTGPEEVAARLAEDYGQERARVFEDVKRFYCELEGLGIIEEVQ